MHAQGLGRFGGKALAALLLAGTALATLAGMATAEAQAPSRQAAGAGRPFSIGPQSLPNALTLFGQQSGLQVSVDAAAVRGLSSPGVSGMLTAQAALGRLLAGTGLGYRLTDARTVVIAKPGSAGAVNTPDGSIALDTIEVQGESAWGPVQGIVASRSATGSKTDAPLIEAPQSISVVTADQIRAQGATTVGEALRYTPGIDSEAYGNDARFGHFTVRGFQVDKFQFVDGLKFPAGGYALARIDPFGLERVEVLRGPTSGLYGQNVPGGMINLVSKRPSATPVREVEIGTGHPGRIAGAFDVGDAITPDKTLLYRIIGAGSFADTMIDKTTDQRLFIAPSFTYAPTADTTLTILSHLQKDNVDGWSGTFLPMEGTLRPNPNGRFPRSTFVGEPGYDHYRRDQYAIGYEFEHRFSPDLIFRSRTRYADLEVDAPNLYPSGLNPVDMRTLNRSTLRFHDHVRNLTTDNNIEARFALGPTRHTLLVGADYQWLRDRDRFFGDTSPTPPIDIYNPVRGARLPSLVPWTDNRITQRQLGVYVQDQIKLDNWLLTLGGRRDWAEAETASMLAPSVPVKTTDTAYTGRIGLSYLFANGLAPYVSYSTSFEPATGATFEGKPFEPTTGEQYEAGIKFQPPGSKIFLSAAVYELKQQNVVTDDTRPNAPLFSQIQEGEIRVRGVELEAKASLLDGWDLIGSYTFADAVTTQSNTTVGGIPVQGRDVPSIPKHQAALWAKYTFGGGPLAGLGLGAGIRYRGSLYADNINTIRVPDVTLVDLALSYDFGKRNPELKGLTLNVNASNLFDRTFIANCSSGVCYFGGARTVTASLNYKW